MIREIVSAGAKRVNESTVNEGKDVKKLPSEVSKALVAHQKGAVKAIAKLVLDYGYTDDSKDAENIATDILNDSDLSNAINKVVGDYFSHL